jgi:ribosomal protein S18 acetylase RimI-like enzyme
MDIIPDDPHLRLRQDEVADASFLRHLFKRTRAAQFAAAGLPAAMLDTLLEQQYRAQAHGYTAQFPDAITLIILRRNEPVGRLMLAAGELRWRIIDIAVLPEARGQGIGAGVISAVERAATEQDAQELTLSVLSSNAGARRLYARLGFVEVTAGVHIEMRRDLAARR